MTSAGEIVADFITTGTLSAININGVNITGSTITGNTINGGTVNGSSISSGTNGGSLTTINSGRIDCYNASRSERTYISNGVMGLLKPGSNERNDISAGGMFISDYDGSTITVKTTVNKWGFNGTNLYISGSKSRVVQTKDYNKRLLYCYETPSPMFGDIGEGKTDSEGICEIWLDDIFGETIDPDVKYQVFLQNYSEGTLRVTERNCHYRPWKLATRYSL